MHLTDEQLIKKETLAVITHPKYRSLGGIIMMGKTTLEPDAALCPTAYTDGLNTVYGAAFIRDLSPQLLRFIILHEAMHKALRHLLTWLHLWEEDKDTANKACDMVINILLMLSDAGEGFIAMPAGGVFDLRFQGMDAGEVYRLMRKEAKEQGKQGGEPGGFDSHGWEEAKALSAEEAKALDVEVKQALQQGGVLAGKMAGEMSRAIGDILAPTIDWKEVLREFVMSTCSGHDLSTWRRPNRRYIGMDIYMPSHYSESAGRLLLGVDASGSITGKAINTFLSEAVGIAKLVTPELIDLLYWDARVQAHEKYNVGQYESIATSTKPKGGGGTSPSCVTAYMAEHKLKPQCVVMLTDGEVGGDWGGAWSCPVLWCIAGNKRITATTGKTVHIGETR